MNTPQPLVPHHQPRVEGGRIIAIDEYGSSAGIPVLLLTSTPGSRRFDPDPHVTSEAGVRLLVVDRPGYGGSSPYPPRTIPTWSQLADDLASVLDALQIDRAGMIGWSQGGIGALALATRHPDRIDAAAMVGTPAHDDNVPWVGDAFRPQLPLQARARGRDADADARRSRDRSGGLCGRSRRQRERPARHRDVQAAAGTR